MKEARTFNRTILELKFSWWDCRVCPVLLSIAPYWNWNGIGFDPLRGLMLLSIAPYWNWNHEVFQMTWGEWMLSIAPYWNWNHHRLTVRNYLSIFQSHHTGIEMLTTMPAIAQLPAFQSHHTGIEILQHWWLIRSFNFQSHHTGIEILGQQT